MSTAESGGPADVTPQEGGRGGRGSEHVINDIDHLQLQSGSTLGLSHQLEAVCVSAVERVGVNGAAVHLSSDVGAGTVVAASSDLSRWVAELEFELGEGPATDAFATVRPVLVPHLAQTGARWPAFVASATARGICAVFALPLHVGAARFGTLTLVRDLAAPLDEAALSAALLVCDQAVAILLGSLDGAVTDGMNGPPRRSLADEVGSSMDLRSEVYQAQGMVMVDLGISLVESLARLRAYGFSQGLSLVDVAQEVVARRLRLVDDREHDRNEDSGL